MRSRWNDADAQACCAQHAAAGTDLALRVYTSRLIGQDPDLVLHGGGNTSVKTTARDLHGREIEVLCVKGSGWDLGAIEPPGLPAVRLEPLRALRALDALADDAMVNAVRSALLDCTAPDPSVETLLHAFLPHRFVDHTHADAILALTDQPDGAELARAALGEQVAILPWIMPGFPLAQAVAAAVEERPDCEGVVLCRHGLFTFGDDARTSYERTIELVDRAERFLRQRIGRVPAMLQGQPEPLPAAERTALLTRALPVLRGAVAMEFTRPWGNQWQRCIAEARTGNDQAAFAASPHARRLCHNGPITPDHVIRTRGRYLFLSGAEATDPDACRRAVAEHVGWYRGYFERCARPLGATAMLPPMPVVAVIEGCGLVALQPARKAARVAADIAEHTLRVWAVGAALGRFVGLSEAQLAEMEYWPLELKKLGRSEPPALQGQVALITGAAGAIGAGIAEVLLEHGACALLTDLDEPGLATVRERLVRHADRIDTMAADLTDSAAVERLFAHCARTFGGVDLLVPSAGIAHVARLEEMDPAAFARVQQVNVQATAAVLQQVARVFRAQRTGGSVVLQASKNALAPGAGFGAYSASKAAVLQLGRIAALELAELGVRVNMINADAVFGDEQVPSRLWQEVGPDRMRARGLDPAGLREHYRQRNLLKVAVTPRQVGEAVLFFALARTPTTGAVLPVDGGLPEAFPR